QVDWQLVSTLAHSPRGIPVPITMTDTSVEQIVAAAPRVQNVLPDGSTWDGRSDLPMDEGTFRPVLTEVEAGSAAGAPTTGSTQGGPAPNATPAGSRTAPPNAPKNGG